MHPARPLPQRPAAALSRWPVALAAACLLGTSAWAAPSIRIEPTATVSETFTNNVGLAATGQANDAITRIDLGLGLRSRQGSVQGFLDYSLSGLVYARQSERNGHLQNLNARANVEWYERRGFLDIRASIGQAALSAFSVQPGAQGLLNGNSTEVRNLSLAPSWRGQFGPEVAYTVAGDYSVSSTKDSVSGDANSSSLSLGLSNARARRLGWGLTLTHQRSGYSGGRSTQGTRLVGAGQWDLSELDLQLSANAGIERSTLTSVSSDSQGTWGLGAVWSPSPRTKLSAQFEDRAFGNTHVLSLQHRTPLTVWTLSDSRTLSTNGNLLGTGGNGTLFDLFFTQFASLEPDEAKRTELVNNFLRNYGLDPRAGLSAGLLSSAATLQDLTSLSVAARGVRSTATLTLSRSNTRRADTVSTGVDDLSRAGRIVSNNVSLNLAHRLTPLSNVSLLLSLLDTQGTQLAQSLRQRSVQLQYSEQLARNGTWGVSLRRTLYETGLVPFAESAAVFTFGLRF